MWATGLCPGDPIAKEATFRRTRAPLIEIFYFRFLIF